MTEASPPATPKRKPSHLKAAGKLLAKEARKIVKKHRGRLGDPVADELVALSAQVDDRLKAKDWVALELHCEDLDELLHQHASFARKGALRETVENVGLAVLVALGLRSCLYEPFKIPSPSMVPTLVPGDHIFVNKYRYGVQIPFTTTIVGEDMISGIERGEVAVFRYPLDPEQDYIKRVIGLPGDQIKVKDEVISIKRPGAADFEFVEQRVLKEPCPDNLGQGTTENCVLIEEDLDGHKYVIKVDRNQPGATRGRTRVLTVPEGHIFVMGDNRRHSADSLQWTQRVEAVFADKLITDKDLRDLTSGRVFRDERSDAFATDADVDQVTFVSERNSKRHDMRIQIWRDPVLGARPVFAALSGDQAPMTLGELAASEPGNLSSGTRRRIDDGASRFLALAVATDAQRRTASFRLRGADQQIEVIGSLSCGLDVCPSAGEFARELLSIADAVDADESRPARELLRRPGGFSYTPKWSGRDGIRSRYFAQSFTLTGHDDDIANKLVVRAWRQPGEGEAFVRRALEAAYGAGKVVSHAAADGTESIDELRLTVSASNYVVYGSSAEKRVLFAVECGRKYCADEREAVAFAQAVESRAARAATEAKQLERLVTREWLETDPTLAKRGKWTRGPGLSEEDLYEWDELTLVSRVRDPNQFARIKVRRGEAQELKSMLEERAAALNGAEPVEFIDGFELANDQALGAYVHVFIEPDTSALIEVQCAPQLCGDLDGARALTKRAAEKAKDVANFVDPQFVLDTPFVPRGNVKGRAERIWAKSPEAGSIFPYRLGFDKIR